MNCREKSLRTRLLDIDASWHEFLATKARLEIARLHLSESDPAFTKAQQECSDALADLNSVITDIFTTFLGDA